ncbi:hypothetical protein D3C75_1193180 [compost metagenome]
MTLWNRHIILSFQPTYHRDVAHLLNRLLYNLVVPCTPAAVNDDTCYIQLRFQLLKPKHNRRGTPCHTTNIYNQDNRCLRDHRNFSS